MEIKNLARLNKAAIESKAIEVLNDYDSNFFTRIRYTPIEDVVKKLTEKYSPTYNASEYLGYTNSGKRILGCYSILNRAILVDASLEQIPERFHFVLAHELGHLILHRKVILGENALIEDTEESFEGKRELKTDLDFMEWQANYFAASILLPQDMFLSVLIYERKKMGIGWRGTIFLDDQPVNIRDYYETINRLKEFFKVSYTAIEIRLEQLNLVQRPEGPRHMAAISKELIMQAIDIRNTRNDSGGN